MMPQVPPQGPEPPPPMDIDLKSCLEGDLEAWDRFCDQTAGVVMAAILRTAGAQLQDPSLPDAEDILQGVYLRLVKHDFRLLSSFDPAKASLVTWLTIVARSTTIDALRRRKPPVQSIHDEHAVEPTAPTAPDNVASEPLDRIAPLHLLTERQRLVIALLFQDHRTVPEAAAILGVGEQTIRSTKHKALERLRKAMPPPDPTAD